MLFRNKLAIFLLYWHTVFYSITYIMIMAYINCRELPPPVGIRTNLLPPRHSWMRLELQCWRLYGCCAHAWAHKIVIETLFSLFAGKIAHRLPILSIRDKIPWEGNLYVRKNRSVGERVSRVGGLRCNISHYNLNLWLRSVRSNICNYIGWNLFKAQVSLWFKRLFVLSFFL